MSDTKPNSKLMHATVQGTLWVYATRYSGKVMVFISTIILARLLNKADYGLAGYATVVIGFLDVLQDLGIGAAVIYADDDDEIIDTAFWLNLAAGVTLFLATWLLAPLAGSFFNDMRAVPLTRVLALNFPLNALSNIHSSLLDKRMTFRRKFLPDFAGSVGKGIISILLAWLAFGPWSLVLGQVGGTAVAVVAYWFVNPWRPSLRFIKKRARPLLTYGSNIVAVNALGVTLNNADYLFIGRFLGAEALGVYTLAFRIPELLVKQFCQIVGNVLFPAYSLLRDKPKALSRGFLLAMRTISMVTVPIALGLGLVARPMVLTLFTDKWAEAIPIIAAISIYTLIRSLTFNIGNVYKAQGRPEVLTRLSLLKIPILLPGLWWAVQGPGTIEAVAWIQVAASVVSAFINIVAAARLLHTPILAIVAELKPAALGGILMALAVWPTLEALRTTPPLLQLVAGVLVGALVYAAAIWWLERDFVLQAKSNLRAALVRS